MSIFYPIHTVRSVLHCVYRGNVGIGLSRSIAIDRSISIVF